MADRTHQDIYSFLNLTFFLVHFSDANFLAFENQHHSNHQLVNLSQLVTRELHPNYPLRTLTWLAGKSTIKGGCISDWKWGIFQYVMFSIFQGCKIIMDDQWSFLNIYLTHPYPIMNFIPHPGAMVFFFPTIPPGCRPPLHPFLSLLDLQKATDVDGRNPAAVW